MIEIIRPQTATAENPDEKAKSKDNNKVAKQEEKIVKEDTTNEKKETAIENSNPTEVNNKASKIPALSVGTKPKHVPGAIAAPAKKPGRKPKRKNVQKETTTGDDDDAFSQFEFSEDTEVSVTE